MKSKLKIYFSVITTLTLMTAFNVHAAQYNVTFTNTAPSGGTYLTPAWVGFHDGTFDVFDAGGIASSELERIAEDGNTAPLSASFSGFGVDTTVGAAPIAPGASVSSIFNLSNDGSNDYLSLASMILPSSDFFIGNDYPHAYSVADLLDGNTNSVTFVITRAYDAGTEVNDFNTSPGNPLVGFPLGQTAADQGVDENSFIRIASGTDFLLFANLDGNDVSGLNFDNFQSIATIEVSAVPLPAGLPLFMSALAAFGFIGKRRQA